MLPALLLVDFGGVFDEVGDVFTDDLAELGSQAAEGGADAASGHAVVTWCLMRCSAVCTTQIPAEPPRELSALRILNNPSPPCLHQKITHGHDAVVRQLMPSG